MTRGGSSAGFSLAEMLVSLALVMVALSMIGKLIVENSKINKTQQLTIEAQSSARSTLSLVSQVLRTAGWDPIEVGTGVVTLDADATDGIETLDVFADLNGDGLIDGVGESVTIRFIEDRVEWRRRVGDPWEIVGIHITNDADGDGVPELMFTPDVTPDPTRITVRVTAGVAPPYPGALPIRYTVESDVVLRNVE